MFRKCEKSTFKSGHFRVVQILGLFFNSFSRCKALLLLLFLKSMQQMMTPPILTSPALLYRPKSENGEESSDNLSHLILLVMIKITNISRLMPIITASQRML
jgi:hypothetical protein